MFDKIAQIIADLKMRRMTRKAWDRGLEAQRQEAIRYQMSRGKGFGA